MKWASVLSQTLFASDRILYCHLLLSEVVTLIHLPDKVGSFGFVGNDDLDHFASFLLLGELSSKKCDDVGHVGYPCLIEGFGGVGAFPVMTLHQLVWRWWRTLLMVLLV